MITWWIIFESQPWLIRSSNLIWSSSKDKKLKFVFLAFWSIYFFRLSELSILTIYRTGATNLNHHIKCFFGLFWLLTVKKKKEGILFESLSDKCLGIIAASVRRNPQGVVTGWFFKGQTAKWHGNAADLSKRLGCHTPFRRSSASRPIKNYQLATSRVGPSTDGSFSSSNHHINFSKNLR